ncbi:(deoxy)nucleoside triphosphate pyrophosphohydrolase [Oecophyllibacter saccharovorans]|uniref:8-oxo-dGTP diphosphatase n=1 Tax=Oecophyllibacter saccharovorans TaxID=2558360 RepID=A0A506UQ07_9PROT|nr:(deoxy)nucleoside triphosphate pyrophosphohydrolase [Oecophyllibacter saccharovorans]QDH15652.1 (deoxy)nucleoside triphosphate pyrophosphohydrolase [Oecophyllibacter saccharovorans]TPW35427.1 (deoxy)nucleoside triphosphate pyrophosphohydrolase [Oecophyllibacter saccharovorans]
MSPTPPRTNQARTRRILLVVAAVLIDREGQILVAQRPEGKSYAGWWEFPGGKVERDESPERALVRELGEELGIEALEEDLEPFTFISTDCGSFHLLMPVYLLQHWEGTPTSRENQTLAWIRPEALGGLQLLKPDLPLVPRLEAYFQRFSP